ncbi:Erlin-2 [Thalictrum thalictroides]|uniref:Erlin-2 n=1 Tax=Thalictrum thalictroides TaxID=46969 RepID=A0A7J6WIB3_THATH|nr:Erlin-2 [Thalictrum thalictroides]
MARQQRARARLRLPRSADFSFVFVIRMMTSVLLIIATCVKTSHSIPEGHVGVYWRGGALLTTVSEPGLHFKLPLITQFQPIQVTVQTAQVRDIQCGTKGGVMISFEKIEVEYRLSKAYVYATLLDYGIYYEKTWLYAKIRHEINLFCNAQSLQEVYIDIFEQIDEKMIVALQGDCTRYVPGIKILAVRVTKPTIPSSIRRNFEQLEEKRTKALAVIERQKVAETDAETQKKIALAKAEKSAQQMLMEDSARRQEEIQKNMYITREKCLADANICRMLKEGEANRLKLTPEFLELQFIQSIAKNYKIFFGDKESKMVFDQSLSGDFLNMAGRKEHLEKVPKEAEANKLKRTLDHLWTTASRKDKHLEKYALNKSSDIGGFGEVWLASSVSPDSCPEINHFFILKRIMVGRSCKFYLSGLREKYFGELFSSMPKPHLARYVESFQYQEPQEMWLVFQHEGISLSRLMYTTNNQVRELSTWWHWLRTTELGQEAMRKLIWQLFTALKSCHDQNITHRDIKPENMVVCLEDEITGRCHQAVPSGDKPYHIKMRLIDFGSAIDPFAIKHLYGSYGPSEAEQTYDYTPPEAILYSKWFDGPKSAVLKYDMWSVGVVMLELIIGSPDVFQLNARTHAILHRQLDSWNEDRKELAFRLWSLMEFCIMIPGTASERHTTETRVNDVGVPLASSKCSEESFSHQVKTRDPLKQGFPNIWALRLVRQLLMWDTEARLSVDEALQHPYFHQPS